MHERLSMTNAASHHDRHNKLVDVDTLTNHSINIANFLKFLFAVAFSWILFSFFPRKKKRVEGKTFPRVFLSGSTNNRILMFNSRFSPVTKWKTTDENKHQDYGARWVAIFIITRPSLSALFIDSIFLLLDSFFLLLSAASISLLINFIKEV